MKKQITLLGASLVLSATAMANGVCVLNASSYYATRYDLLIDGKLVDTFVKSTEEAARAACAEALNSPQVQLNHQMNQLNETYQQAKKITGD